MALPAIQDFLAAWPGTAKLTLGYGDEVSGDANSGIIVKNLRSPLWMLSAVSKDLLPREMDAWLARLESLDNGQGLFWGFDTSRYWPIAYPGGSWPTRGVFSGATAQILALGGDNKSLSLESLPVGYGGSVGDQLSFAYGDPVSNALHRVVEAFTADGSGHTAVFEVRPFLRPGATTGLSVAVKKPVCKMMLVPNSIAPSMRDTTGRGTLTFQGMQVV